MSFTSVTAARAVLLDISLLGVVSGEADRSGVLVAGLAELKVLNDGWLVEEVRPPRRAPLFFARMDAASRAFKQGMLTDCRMMVGRGW